MAGGPPDPNDRSRFENFTIHSTSYKTVHDHSIAVDVIYPTKLLSDPIALNTPRPVILRFHGGGLITGSSLYPGFFGKWLLEFAEKHNAIIVSADNQLFPEASPADILADIHDIWAWIQSSLAAYLAKETNGSMKADLSRIIASGESAGGLLALLFGLAHPAALKAVMVQYPVIDLKSRHYTQDYDKQPFGMPASYFPESLIDDLVKKAAEHKAEKGSPLVVSNDAMVERVPAFFSALIHGRFGNFIDDKDGGADLYVYDRMERGQKFPRGGVFVWHGTDDSVVPVEGSYKLEKIARETDPDLKFRLNVQPGEHGFDGESKLEDEWVRGFIQEIEVAWLS